MVTHNVHFILLALGLKKKFRAWVGRTQLEENKEIIGHQGQCVMEWMKRGSGSLHAEIKSPLPTSLLLCHKNLLEITVVCYLFPLPVCGLSRKDLRISQLIFHLHLQDKVMEWGAIGYGSFFGLVLHIWEKIRLRPLTLDKAEMFLSYVLQKHKQLFLLLLTHFSLLCPHWFSR